MIFNMAIERGCYRPNNLATRSSRFISKCSATSSRIPAIVSRNGYMMLTVLGGCEPKMAAALSGNLVAEESESFG